jgi:molybdenum cofactor cytidylyltransferase
MVDRSLTIIDAIPLEENSCLAIVGGGGKSSLMFALAYEWSGKSIIVTTTTHLGTEQANNADHHLIIEDDDFCFELLEVIRNHKVILVTGPQTSDRTRWSGLTESQMEGLATFADIHKIPILVEADGSRGRPIKAPACHEPAIPKQANTVVVVVGLSALDTVINSDNVHRVDEFSRVTQKNVGEKITAEAITSMLVHGNGGLKNVPPESKKYLLLNQADNYVLVKQGLRIANNVKSNYDRIIICKLKPSVAISYCITHVGGVILAAGEGVRFGKIKQLLRWKNATTIQSICKTANDAGLDPVIVVLGSHSEVIRKAINNLPVLIVDNEEWEKGQAGSVKKGVNALPDRNCSVIFLLADQPQITTDIIHRLIQEHQTTLSPVIYPVYKGQRGNPVLFDRSTFGELLKLEGDAGGKKVIERFSNRTIVWNDDSILHDIDTPEDYKRIKDRFNG